MKMAKDPAWREAVGQRLVRYRVVIGKKQTDIATALGITSQRLSNYENGRRPFDIDLAMILCERFGLTLDYIYRGAVHTLPLELAEKIEPIRVPPRAMRN